MPKRLAISNLALAILAVIALVVPSAASAAEVRVVALDGSASTVDLRQHRGSEDIVNRPYAIRSESGEQTRRLTGFSLAWVLDRAGVDAYTFNYLSVARPGGGTVLLDAAQARNAGAFPDGPPVVAAAAAGAQFTRPSAGAGDANAADTFTAEPLVIELHRGALIEVEAVASTLKAEPGQPIRFRAVLERAGAGSQVRFSWTFDDGKGATGAQVTHRFTKPGTYDVVVGATTAADRTGGSDTVTVQVGEPRRKGPHRKGGGTNRAKGAPDSGSSTGASGAGGGGGASGTGDAGGPAAPGANAAGPATPAKERGARPEPGGERVAGDLLSGLDGAPVETASAASEEEPAPKVAARVGSGEAETGLEIPGVAIGALGVLGLLGTGAAAELEVLRRGRRWGAG